MVKALIGVISLLVGLGFGGAIALHSTIRSEVAQAKTDLRAEITTARQQDMGYLTRELTEIKQRQDTMLKILIERKP